jgi:hypothetical protein
MRFNQAATLDPGPIISNATLRSPVVHPVGGPGRHDAQTEEARQYFSEGGKRSIFPLGDAIRKLEDEIAAPQPLVEAPKESRTAQKISEVQTPRRQPPHAALIDLKAAWRRVTRWLGSRN